MKVPTFGHKNVQTRQTGQGQWYESTESRVVTGARKQFPARGRAQSVSGRARGVPGRRGGTAWRSLRELAGVCGGLLRRLHESHTYMRDAHPGGWVPSNNSMCARTHHGHALHAPPFLGTHWGHKNITPWARIPHYRYGIHAGAWADHGARPRVPGGLPQPPRPP